MNQDNIQQLRDKVADIKYDTQQVLDRIDSMDAAYQEQTGREQALESKVAQLKAEVDKARLDKVCALLCPSFPRPWLSPSSVRVWRMVLAEFARSLKMQLTSKSATECMGNFEVEFSQYIDLSDHLDIDWLRGKTDEIGENFVLDCLSNLCADKGVRVPYPRG